MSTFLVVFFQKKTKNPLQKKNDLITFLQKGTVIQVRMKNEVRILKELLSGYPRT